MDTSTMSLSLHALAPSQTQEHPDCLSTRDAPDSDPASISVVLKVTGEVDMLSRDCLYRTGGELLALDVAAGGVRQALGSSQAATAGPPHLLEAGVCVVDLSEVTFMDCAGLAGLLALLRSATAQRWRVALVATRPPATLVLQATQVSDVYPLAEDVAAAQRHLTQGGAS